MREDSGQKDAEENNMRPNGSSKSPSRLATQSAERACRNWIPFLIVGTGPARC